MTTPAETDKLLKELRDLSEMLLAAEASAGKALEQVSILRRHHRAKLEEWRKACRIGEHALATDDKVEVGEVTPDPDELLAGVSGAIKRAEEASEVRLDAGPSTDPSSSDTIETREDGATRPPSDPDRNESGPREHGRSDA